MARKATHLAAQTVAEAERRPTTTTTTRRADAAALAGFQGHRFLNLTTYRKSGAPVVTTVLFAQADDMLYVWTTSDSGKVKRIRTNPTVQIAPSTRLGRTRGPSITATARLVGSSERCAAEAVTDRQFGRLKLFFGLIWRLQGHDQVYLALTPTEV